MEEDVIPWPVARPHVRCLGACEGGICVRNDRYCHWLAIHGYVLAGFFEESMSRENWWWYLLPLFSRCLCMYTNAVAIVPVIEVFVANDVPIGTTIVFMMATGGLSLPEAALLKKVVTWKWIGIFFGTVTTFIILSDYIFNIIITYCLLENLIISLKMNILWKAIEYFLLLWLPMT